MDQRYHIKQRCLNHTSSNPWNYKGVLYDNLFINMKEGNCYKISNFGLALYDAKIKHCSHKYKIIFAQNTTISPSPSLSVPIHGFNFTEFEKKITSTLDKSFHYG
ncbi:hypothetical protein V2J09_004979 [Rumex salicifolius]